jgi:hypothetical protein
VAKKNQVNKIMVQLENATQEAVVDMALRIHGKLVEDTPVDTGWARSNWLPSVGVPRRETVGEPGSLDTGAAGLGQSEVVDWKIADGPIYITNNVPYIRRLNAGSSTQAPAGFVESAIQTEVNKANRRKLR